MNNDEIKKEFAKEFSDTGMSVFDIEETADWWLYKLDRAKEEGFNWSQDVKQADFEQWKMAFRSELIGKIGGIRKDMKCSQDNKAGMHYECGCPEKSNYNQAIDDIINLIKEGK